MTSHEVYVFFLCLIVFTLLVGLLSYLIVTLIRSQLKMIRLGAEDESIKTEYAKKTSGSKKRASRTLEYVGCAIALLLAALALASFVVSVVIGAKSNSVVGNTPALKVVKSNSMSYKYPDNEYLFENALDDQIKTYDLILLHKLPAEEKLEKYDIVAYERDGMLILHRIVNIEEPNEKHPNERYFLLQGDAVEYHDKFPVLYEDMKGIYEGERFPLIGSFFMFMQSPAGILCILLIIFAMVATPIVEKELKNAKDQRYALITGKSISSDK